MEYDFIEDSDELIARIEEIEDFIVTLENKLEDLRSELLFRKKELNAMVEDDVEDCQ